MEELQGNALLWSTIMEMPARRKETKSKQCLFCGQYYTGGPFNIKVHLDGSLKPRSIRLCKPSSQWMERYGEVLAELRRRSSAERKAAEEGYLSLVGCSLT